MSGWLPLNKAIPLTPRNRGARLKLLAALPSMNACVIHLALRIGRLSLLAIASAAITQRPVLGQDRSADQAGLRGNRAEVAITVKDGSSQLIGPLVTVKLYYLGALAEQTTTTKGRVVFILNRLGDYTITADAVGYRSSQKEISVPVSVEAEEEIILQRDTSPEALGAAARPVLAPKAKEALDKGMQALKDNKLDEAQKYLDGALKLAPSHPDVLYGRAVLYLMRSDWANAQTLLEKATQLDPKHARALSALGMAFVNAGKFDQAVPPLQQSLALEPARWETHWELAKAYYHQQQYEQAVKESQESWTESHGASPEIELLLAQSLTAVGRYEEAAQTLRDFLKIHPDGPRANTARRWLTQLTAELKTHQN